MIRWSRVLHVQWLVGSDLPVEAPLPSRTSRGEWVPPSSRAPPPSRCDAAPWQPPPRAPGAAARSASYPRSDARARYAPVPLSTTVIHCRCMECRTNQSLACAPAVAPGIMAMAGVFGDAVQGPRFCRSATHVCKPTAGLTRPWRQLTFRRIFDIVKLIDCLHVFWWRSTNFSKVQTLKCVGTSNNFLFGECPKGSGVHVRTSYSLPQHINTVTMLQTTTPCVLQVCVSFIDGCHCVCAGDFKHQFGCEHRWRGCFSSGHWHW